MTANRPLSDDAVDITSATDTAFGSFRTLWNWRFLTWALTVRDVKLRYKLPDGDTSKLIEQAVPSAALTAATAPKGDFAFAAAVAAYGQVLRGDEMMLGFGFDDIGKLAGSQDNFWRQEFLQWLLDGVVAADYAPEAVEEALEAAWDYIDRDQAREQVFVIALSQLYVELHPGQPLPIEPV